MYNPEFSNETHDILFNVADERTNASLYRGNASLTFVTVSGGCPSFTLSASLLMVTVSLVVVAVFWNTKRGGASE